MTLYYIMRQISAILLQTVTEIYYKMRQVFLLQNPTVLLQNVTVITGCDSFITKCDDFYKMGRLLQIHHQAHHLKA